MNTGRRSHSVAVEAVESSHFENANHLVEHQPLINHIPLAFLIINIVWFTEPLVTKQAIIESLAKTDENIPLC